VSDSNIEHLSTSEREKALKRRAKKSPEQYAEERTERVGDQLKEVEEDQERNEKAAELLHDLHEHEKKLKEALGSELEKVAMKLQQYDAKQWDDLSQAFAHGQYSFKTEPQGKHIEISIVIDAPEGNVQEKIPLKKNTQQDVMQSLKKAA
jgi:hypothetical protein